MYSITENGGKKTEKELGAENRKPIELLRLLLLVADLYCNLYAIARNPSARTRIPYIPRLGIQRKSHRFFLRTARVAPKQRSLGLRSPICISKYFLGKANNNHCSWKFPETWWIRIKVQTNSETHAFVSTRFHAHKCSNSNQTLLLVAPFYLYGKSSRQFEFKIKFNWNFAKNYWIWFHFDCMKYLKVK